MTKRTINFPEKDQALSDDVNTLGAIVGEVLVEQYGQALYERVEALRVAAIARRESASVDLDSLDEQITDADLEEARNLIRGFSGYFQVVNLAEKSIASGVFATIKKTAKRYRDRCYKS